MSKDPEGKEGGKETKLLLKQIVCVLLNSEIGKDGRKVLGGRKGGRKG